uniref:Uncharacterized protein n=1 Tax=Arundo donax TaxID=35708 RepID=A0A0A9GMC1_ARUDO
MQLVSSVTDITKAVSDQHIQCKISMFFHDSENLFLYFEEKHPYPLSL